MSCPHRFLGYHAADSLLPDWEFDYLFIGTFNPVWDFSTGENASYFYGRTKNNYFWDLVPEIWALQKMRTLDVAKWQQLLQQHQIGVTDLIRNIEDANPQNAQHQCWLKSKSDGDLVRFQQIVWNTSEILRVIARKQKLKGIFVTNQRAPGKIEHQIQLLEQAANRHQIYFARLITPSGGARFQFSKGTKLYEALFDSWKQKIDLVLKRFL
ncbi:MAG: hypothetical protein U0X71_09205 [Sphingobacteriaceae bacterium]